MLRQQISEAATIQIVTYLILLTILMIALGIWGKGT